MGWTSFNLSKPVKEWFIDSWNSVDDREVLDVSIVNRTELYAAIKDKKTEEIFAVIYILSYSPKSYYNFSYKDMDETCGPCFYNCPEKILKLLTPLLISCEYSQNWRIKCWDNINNRKQLNSIKKNNNVIIKTNDVISFVGNSYQYFKHCNLKGYKNIYDAYEFINGNFIQKNKVRLNLKNYKFSVINL